MPYLMYALFFIFLTYPLFAHGGGLNKVGCHNKRKTGDYHCHRGPKASSKRPVTSRQEMLSGSYCDRWRYYPDWKCPYSPLWY